MKKAVILFALLVALSGCGSAKPTVSSQSESSSAPSVSEVSSDVQSESELSSEAAASEAAAKAASEAAVSEAAAKTASEAAASEAAAKAASEAAVSEAAAKAASEAAVSEAAETAASEAAVSESEVKAASESSKIITEPISAKPEAEAAVKTVTGTNFLNTVEKSILTKINKEREAQGLAALSYNEDLRSAARIRSRELYKADKFEHKRPNGDEWQTVLEDDIPVEYIAAGENLCMTEYNDPNNHSAKSASFWVEQWMNSPPHYENIIRSEYTHAGVGVYYMEKDGMVYGYATMIFAQL